MLATAARWDVVLQITYAEVVFNHCSLSDLWEFVLVLCSCLDLRAG